MNITRCAAVISSNPIAIATLNYNRLPGGNRAQNRPIGRGADIAGRIKNESRRCSRGFNRTTGTQLTDTLEHVLCGDGLRPMADQIGARDPGTSCAISRGSNSLGTKKINKLKAISLSRLSDRRKIKAHRLATDSRAGLVETGPGCCGAGGWSNGGRWLWCCGRQRPPGRGLRRDLMDNGNNAKEQAGIQTIDRDRRRHSQQKPGTPFPMQAANRRQGSQRPKWTGRAQTCQRSKDLLRSRDLSGRRSSNRSVLIHPNHGLE